MLLVPKASSIMMVTEPDSEAVHNSTVQQQAAPAPGFPHYTQPEMQMHVADSLVPCLPTLVVLW